MCGAIWVAKASVRMTGAVGRRHTGREVKTTWHWLLDHAWGPLPGAQMVGGMGRVQRLSLTLGGKHVWNLCTEKVFVLQMD